jgi:pimeloyl-ACP methyl ester carboxylesterase
MLAHLGQTIDALGGKTVVLAGLSMGAALAAHYAVAQPQRVRGLVMVSPVGFSGIPGLAALRGITPAKLTSAVPRLASRSLVRMLLFGVNGKLRRITQRDIDEYWAPTQFPEFAIAMRHLLHEFSWSEPFRRLSVPSVLITGTTDRMMLSSHVEMYRREMPELQHIVVQDAGHVVFDEAAPIVNAAMIEFFKNH